MLDEQARVWVVNSHPWRKDAGGLRRREYGVKLTRPFSMSEALAVLVAIGLAMALSIFVFHVAAYLPLFGALAACCCLAARHGHSARAVAEMAWRGVKKAAIPIVMLTLIGALMGLWRLNGTSATLALYGGNIVRPRYFVVASFLVCGAVSLVVGTASGATSIIGLPLMIIGQTYQVPGPLLAGAIISGAYLGDRSSPVSSVLHMAARLTATDPRTVFRRLFSTLLPAVAAATLLYWLMDPSSTATLATREAIPALEALRMGHGVSPGLLAVPLLAIVMAALRVPILANLGASVLTACVVGLAVRHASLADIVRTALVGHYPAPTGAVGSAITSGGGIASMTGVLLVLVSSTALSGVLVDAGVMDAVFDAWLSRLRDARRILLATMAFSVVTGMVASNQATAVVLPCVLFQRVYREEGLPGLALAHVVSDSGVIAAPLVPWSAAALGPAEILGVSPTDYVPYAFLCWTLPLITGGLVIAGLGPSLHGPAGDARTSGQRSPRRRAARPRGEPR